MKRPESKASASSEVKVPAGGKLSAAGSNKGSQKQLSASASKQGRESAHSSQKNS